MGSIEVDPESLRAAAQTVRRMSGPLGRIGAVPAAAWDGLGSALEGARAEDDLVELATTARLAGLALCAEADGIAFAFEAAALAYRSADESIAAAAADPAPVAD